jgi:hypothetical protein
MGLEDKSPEEIERLANWANSVLNNKDTRLDALRLTKKANPNAHIPELDRDAAIQAVRDEEAKKREALEARLDKQEIEAARRDKAAQLAAKGFDIVAVEKVMTDNGIGNYDTAMKFMRAEAQVAGATQSVLDSGNAKMPENFKDIMKNPAAWAREQATTILNEARAGISQ